MYLFLRSTELFYNGFMFVEDFFINFVEPRRRRGLPPVQILCEFFGNLAIEFIENLFYKK